MHGTCLRREEIRPTGSDAAHARGLPERPSTDFGGKTQPLTHRLTVNTLSGIKGIDATHAPKITAALYAR